MKKKEKVHNLNSISCPCHCFELNARLDTVLVTIMNGKQNKRAVEFKTVRRA